jgi:drug/metabolite transporter (DMT)-like permease
MFSLLIWLNLAFLSLVGGLGYLLWYYALAHAQAGQVAIFSQLTPVVAVTLSVILGQDLLTVPLFVGAGAVIAGVTLTRLG